MLAYMLAPREFPVILTAIDRSYYGNGVLLADQVVGKIGARRTGRRGLG